jgi:hypothetical protein
MELGREVGPPLGLKKGVGDERETVDPHANEQYDSDWS